MKIKPYFKSALAKPFQGKHFHDVGTTVVMNTEVHTKTIGDFIIMLPDPVSLNLNNAQGFIDKSGKLKERINKAKKSTVFSKILNETVIAGRSNEEIKALDPAANIFRVLDQDKVFEYIQSSIGVVVSLITAVESFVNLIIPYNYVHSRTNRKGEKETLDKVQVVRKLSIEEKLEIVTIIKGKGDLKQQSFWNSFKIVKDLRDNVIHFKKMDNNINQMWSPIIAAFFDSDLQKLFDDIVALIGYLDPKYLES
ncbi:MAG: hypothetical protein KGI45_00815 [Patescibacteria group bacterium]|nr:hypothetical protein [Patescibacteria group bacterium]MDE1940819.1 hypothetical protein [Patescibacteria group bacterium]MDE1966598.1 hypothetical protein [Patescibacteria group bacterium]